MGKNKGAGASARAWTGGLPWVAGLVLGGAGALVLHAAGAAQWLSAPGLSLIHI